jgi:protein-disulfide isomerase
MLKQFAKNVNVSDISNCMQSHRHDDIVNKNNNLANSIGLQATPTFILLATNNNTLQQQKPIAIVGAQPYSAFEQTIAKIQSSISAT